jgi:periplasmic copper chaperone A
MDPTAHPRRLAAKLLLMLVAAGAVHAGEPAGGNLLITQAWSRPTPPVAASGVVYLTITNRGSAMDHLVALMSPAARSTEIHESRSVNGMMEMRQLAQLDCPAGATVKIEPNGLHIMLLGLVRPLQSGAQFPLTLRFQHAGEVTVQVHVGARE